MDNRSWMKWYWPAMALVWIVSFAIPEYIALAHNGMSLSEWVWRAEAAWPMLGWVMGVLAGGLAVHFFWVNQGLKSRGPK